VYHLNLLNAGWIALFVLGLLRLDTAKPGRAVVLTGVSFALVAQSSGYYGVAAIVIGLVFVVHQVRTRRLLLLLCAAGTLATLLTLPYLQAFLAVHEEQGMSRALVASEAMAFHPTWDLGSQSYLYRRLLGSRGERMFPGLLALGLAPFAFRRPAREAAFLALAVLSLLVLSLGPSLVAFGYQLTLPYRWLVEVPPFDSMRHPISFAVVAVFLLAVLAGLGWSKLALAARPGAGAAVVLLAVLEVLAPPPRLQSAPRGLPPIYQFLETLPPGITLDLPVFDAKTLVWAARHGRPVANGQAAFAPLETLRLGRYLDNHWLRDPPRAIDGNKATRLVLERWPIRYLIVPVGRRPWLAQLALACDRSAHFKLLTTAVAGDRLYELIR